MKKAAIVLLFIPVGLFAQQKRAVKTGWRGIATAGVTGGESGVSPVFQLSAGKKYHRYFYGIGLGYDAYEFNSFPVFANGSVSIGKRQLVYVYAMPGYNIPGKFTKDIENPITIDERQRGGFYLDAGIGYRFPFGQYHRLSFSAGYAHKSVGHVTSYSYPCGFMPCTDTEPHKYDRRYNYNRITTRLSWEIGR